MKTTYLSLLGIIAILLVGGIAVPTGDAAAAAYLNSREPFCNGSDPTILLCEDFEDGVWYATDCDNSDKSRNKGWCGTIFAPITPPNAAVCGGQGAGGTNCSGTSGPLDGHRGAGNMADHCLGPNMTTTSCNSTYSELYIRYYIRTSAGTQWSQEKHLTLNRQLGSGGIIVTNFAIYPGGELIACPTVNPGTCPKGFDHNISALSIQPDRWYYVEHHIILNTPGQLNGTWELWMDDCGANGVCTGSSTLRARHTNAGYRDSSNTNQIGTLWLENWGNNRPGGSTSSDGSIGTHYYDQLVVATRRIGPMGNQLPVDATRPNVPTGVQIR